MQVIEKMPDKAAVLVLNSYIMSNLPPEPKFENYSKPIRNMMDVKQRIQDSAFLKEQGLQMDGLLDMHINQVDKNQEEL